MKPHMPKTSVRVFALASAMMLTTTFAHAGAMELISVSSEGVPGNGSSWFGLPGKKVSSDGRFVVFMSTADSLVENDSNGKQDIFVRDRKTGKTELVSLGNDGTQGNGDSYNPAISADGRFVVFWSYASNLTPGDSNGYPDVFIHARETPFTEKISTTAHFGAGSPSISGDGKRVVYTVRYSWFPRLMKVLVYDRETGVTMDPGLTYSGGTCDISQNGRYVSFCSGAALVPDDTNGSFDIYRHDLQTGVTSRESVSTEGYEAHGGRDTHHPAISANGRFIAFASTAYDLVSNDSNGGWMDIFVRNVEEATTEIVSNSMGIGINRPMISGDGRFVVFDNVKYVYLHDRETNVTEIVSRDENDVPRYANYPSISPDGRFVVFRTSHSFVPEDKNGQSDIYLWSRTKDKDGDGYEDGVDCNDGEFSINPGVPEIPYNGADENCNGMADDDDLDGDGFGIDEDCDDSDAGIFPGTSEIKHDGIDQDCNGYDLTIEITKARYFANSDKLRVEATSSWGQTAALEVEGYGPMKWDAAEAKWVINIKEAGGNPDTVRVLGREGSISVPVELRPKDKNM